MSDVVTAVFDQFDVWSKSAAVGEALSPRNRTAYLVVDYGLRLGMGGFEGFFDDPAISSETVRALRTVGLAEHATVLETALRELPSEVDGKEHRLMAALESAIPNLQPTDHALLAAVFDFIEGRDD